MFKSLLGSAVVVALTYSGVVYPAECAIGESSVSASSLNVRTEPVSGNVVGRLQRGESVTVAECKGVWARIGSARWVHGGYLAANRPNVAGSGFGGAKAARFRRLRDDGIDLVGWVAGNSYNHPIWPQLKPYVGRGGQYYDFFVSLAPPGLSKDAQQAEALGNVRRYQKSFERGKTRSFNERDNNNKTKRMLQIAEEVVGIYK